MREIAVSAILALVLIVIIIIRVFISKKRKTKTIVIDTFKKDKLIEVKKLKKEKTENNLFENNGKDNKAIPSYIISITKRKKYLLIKFDTNYLESKVKVNVYNKKRKLIKIIFIEKDEKKNYSDKLILPNKAYYVNVEIDNGNNILVKNYNYALLTIDSLIILFSYFSLVYITLTILAQKYVSSFLRSNNGKLTYLIIVIAVLLNAIFVNFLDINKKRK